MSRKNKHTANVANVSTPAPVAAKLPPHIAKLQALLNAPVNTCNMYGGVGTAQYYPVQAANAYGGVGTVPYAPGNTGTYYIAKPGNAVQVGNVANPQAALQKAVTLVLQLVPLVSNNSWLTPQEQQSIMQQLLGASYAMEIAACTPAHLAKIGTVQG